jgi:hypothetical protein
MLTDIASQVKVSSDCEDRKDSQIRASELQEISLKQLPYVVARFGEVRMFSVVSQGYR